MELEPRDKEMVQDITRMGVRTAVLLRGVMLQKVDADTLRWGLSEINPDQLMEKYMAGPNSLANRPDCVHLLNLLHLIYSLNGQLDYQIQEYGLDSLKDDLQEINVSLRQVGEQFDLESLREAI
jgi:hypothetical protein